MLNRIVNAYLEFAELRALQRKVMTMSDWIKKLVNGAVPLTPFHLLHLVESQTQGSENLPARLPLPDSPLWCKVVNEV